MSPKISFTIPTYNRAALLEHSLHSLVKSIHIAGISERCEVFISDNCSTDDTRSVLRKWSRLWPDGIRFISHDRQLDAHSNIYYAITAASGEFIKPLNDKIILAPNALLLLVKVIDDVYHDGGLGPIVFTNGHSEVPHNNFKLATVTDLVSKASYMSTWLGSLGIWSRDLLSIGNFNRLADTYLPQVDFTLRTIMQTGIFYISNLPLFGVIPTRASGYNVAKVFGSNYAGILRPYVRSGLLSHEAYRVEMLKVFRHHILPMYFDPHGSHDYLRDGFWEHVSRLNSLFDVKRVTSLYLKESLGLDHRFPVSDEVMP